MIDDAQNVGSYARSDDARKETILLCVVRALNVDGRAVQQVGTVMEDIMDMALLANGIHETYDL